MVKRPLSSVERNFPIGPGRNSLLASLYKVPTDYVDSSLLDWIVFADGLRALSRPFLGHRDHFWSGPARLGGLGAHALAVNCCVPPNVHMVLADPSCRVFVPSVGHRRHHFKKQYRLFPTVGLSRVI
jgi:hypothetical protein